MELGANQPALAVPENKVAAPPTATISDSATKPKTKTSASSQLKVPPSSNFSDPQKTSPTAVPAPATTVHSEPIKRSRTTLNKYPARTPSKSPPIKRSAKQIPIASPSPPARDFQQFTTFDTFTY